VEGKISKYLGLHLQFFKRDAEQLNYLYKFAPRLK
jgi:hypothetical protein